MHPLTQTHMAEKDQGWGVGGWGIKTSLKARVRRAVIKSKRESLREKERERERERERFVKHSFALLVGTRNIFFHDIFLWLFQSKTSCTIHLTAKFSTILIMALLLYLHTRITNILFVPNLHWY